MSYCRQCGSDMGDARFCSNCGAPADPSSAASANAGIDDHVAGALAYLVIPAILFLLIEPYRRNPFVRFHSFQAVFYWAASLVIWIAWGIVGSLLSLIFFFLPFFVASQLLALALLVIWVMLVVKAFQGQRFKLPVIGDMAERQSV